MNETTSRKRPSLALLALTLAGVLLSVVAVVAYVMFRKLPVLGGSPVEEGPAEFDGEVYAVPAE